MPPFTTISIPNATSSTEKHSRLAALPHWQSGKSLRHKFSRIMPKLRRAETSCHPTGGTQGSEIGAQTSVIVAALPVDDRVGTIDPATANLEFARLRIIVEDVAGTDR